MQSSLLQDCSIWLVYLIPASFGRDRVRDRQTKANTRIVRRNEHINIWRIINVVLEREVITRLEFRNNFTPLCCSEAERRERSKVEGRGRYWQGRNYPRVLLVTVCQGGCRYINIHKHIIPNHPCSLVFKRSQTIPYLYWSHNSDPTLLGGQFKSEIFLSWMNAAEFYLGVT